MVLACAIAADAIFWTGFLDARYYCRFRPWVRDRQTDTTESARLDVEYDYVIQDHSNNTADHLCWSGVLKDIT